MPTRIKIALIGLGEIARNQHLRVLSSKEMQERFDLVGGITPHTVDIPIPQYSSLEACLRAHPSLEAVSIATPTPTHYSLANEALQSQLHVLSEKPPTTSVDELRKLYSYAKQHSLIYDPSFHAQHQTIISQFWDILKSVDDVVVRVEVRWLESFSRWHLGQTWPFAPGGQGVMDPGINALSIISRLFEELTFVSGKQYIPSNSTEPVKMELEGSLGNEIPLTAVFDWSHTGEDQREILVHTQSGRVYTIQDKEQLSCKSSITSKHGAILVNVFDDREYFGVYEQFSDLIHKRREGISVVPLMQFVEDALKNSVRILLSKPHP